MSIIMHPAQFCKNLAENQRTAAISEYKKILQSNALTPLASWYRQTKYEAVKNELQKYFKLAARNELMQL